MKHLFFSLFIFAALPAFSQATMPTPPQFAVKTAAEFEEVEDIPGLFKPDTINLNFWVKVGLEDGTTFTTKMVLCSDKDYIFSRNGKLCFVPCNRVKYLTTTQK